ncbi:MAG: hypothetical protein IJZ22_05440 [Bacteroidaceae bacterium]|nr:hypothetical protein [Bacteroidaceae bacterium]
MNNTLNIRRWVKLIIYDNKSSNCIYNVILVGIAILSIVLIIRAILIANVEFESFNPIFGITSNSLLMILGLSPFIFYGSMVKKGKNTLRIMLPASNCEKYLSMLVNTFITTPVIITLTTICLNFIATGFSFEYLVSLSDTTGVIHFITVMWGGISLNTFFLLIFNRYGIWRGIVVIIATTIIELYFIGAVLDFAFNGNVAPTYLSQVLNFIAIVNIFVFQIVVYYITRKIKA